MTIYTDIWSKKKGQELPEIMVDFVEIHTEDGKCYGLEWPETEYTNDGRYSSRCKGAELYPSDEGCSEGSLVKSNTELAKILDAGIKEALVGVSCIGEKKEDEAVVREMSGDISFVIGAIGWVPGKVVFEPVDGWKKPSSECDVHRLHNRLYKRTSRPSLDRCGQV